MADFNLAIIGEADFTRYFADAINKELKLLLVKNSNFNIDFSTNSFPQKTFLPEGTPISNPYGQICSKSFRIDLLHNVDLLTLFFEKELNCNKDLLDELLVHSAKYMDILNTLIIENYGKGLLGFFKKRPLYFIKNYKTFLNLSRGNSITESELKGFLEGLLLFFSPGEINPQYYRKYLLFSLLNKDIYRVNSDNTCLDSLETIDNDKLEEISYESSQWRLRFKNKTVTAHMVISAFPPHIFSLSSIKTPFRIDYDYIFYEFFIENIKTPIPMLDELIFIGEDGTPFLAENRKDAISIYVPYSVNNRPSIDLIKPFVVEFIPYLDLKEAEIKIKYGILPYYHKEKRRKLREKRTFFFPKSYDYPYFGSDGEILYRGRLRDIIWKRFLS